MSPPTFVSQVADLVSRVPAISTALLCPPSAPGAYPILKSTSWEGNGFMRRQDAFPLPWHTVLVEQRGHTPPALKCWNGRLAHRTSIGRGKKMGHEFCCFSEHELPLLLSSSERKAHQR